MEPLTTRSLISTSVPAANTRQKKRCCRCAFIPRPSNQTPRSVIILRAHSASCTPYGEERDRPGSIRIVANPGESLQCLASDLHLSSCSCSLYRASMHGDPSMVYCIFTGPSSINVFFFFFFPPCLILGYKLKARLPGQCQQRDRGCDWR